jgi:hypothetical protein
MNVTSHNGDFQARVAQLAQEWRTNPRWKGITRPYRPEDVIGCGGRTIGVIRWRSGGRSAYGKLCTRSLMWRRWDALRACKPYKPCKPASNLFM